MLQGSTKIIDNVPLSFLDPIFLARSQSNNSHGFIVVTYENFSDIFFFANSVIIDVCRLTPDFRFRIRLDDALDKVYFYKSNNLNSSVFLFHTSKDLFDNFRYTFYCEPCLKMHTSLVSSDSLIHLPELSICNKGILEINSFAHKPFNISLNKVETNITDFLSDINIDGRLILYDIEKNKQVFKERFLGKYDNIDNTINKYSSLISKLDSNTFYFSNSIKQENQIIYNSNNQQLTSQIPVPNVLSSTDTPTPESKNDIISDFEQILSELSTPDFHSNNTISNPLPNEIINLSNSTNTSAFEVAPITPEILLNKSMLEFLNLFYSELRSLVRNHAEIFAHSLIQLQLKYIELKDTTITLEKIDIPIRSYPVLFILAFDCLKQLNHFTQIPKKKKLKEIILNLLQNFYNNKYELLEHFQLIDQIEKIYSTNKS